LGDQLAFYTWWKQRTTSVYTDPKAAFFPFYLPPGLQAAMYHWYTGLKGTPIIKANWVKAIWRVSHPSSYLLAIKHLADKREMQPEKLDKFTLVMPSNLKKCLSILTSSVNE
jgi:hypothetical protein